MFKRVFVIGVTSFLVACGIPLEKRINDHVPVLEAMFTNFSTFTEAFLKNRDEELGLQLASDKVKKILKDPDSALFRNVRYVHFKDKGRLVCGEYNAKNSYGGYIGYALFVGSPAEITTLIDKKPMLYTEIFTNESIKRLCGS